MHLTNRDKRVIHINNVRLLRSFAIHIVDMCNEQPSQATPNPVVVRQFTALYSQQLLDSQSFDMTSTPDATLHQGILSKEATTSQIKPNQIKYLIWF